jgi:hypothetical protein
MEAILSDDFHMWHAGSPTAEPCEGCTFFNGQVHELSYLHARDVTVYGRREAWRYGPFDVVLRPLRRHAQPLRASSLLPRAVEG